MSRHGDAGAEAAPPDDRYLTWDAAYGVETAVAATGLKYGGPNNATANDAFGALIFEVWSTA